MFGVNDNLWFLTFQLPSSHYFAAFHNYFYYFLLKFGSLTVFEQPTYSHHQQGVVPKDRSFTANSGTMAAVLPKGRSSTANSGTKVAVLLGMNRCGSFSLLFALQIVGVLEITLHSYPWLEVDIGKIMCPLFCSSKYVTFFRKPYLKSDGNILQQTGDIVMRVYTNQCYFKSLKSYRIFIF